MKPLEELEEQDRVDRPIFRSITEAVCGPGQQNILAAS